MRKKTMREIIEVETTQGIKKIGYSAMMAPSNMREIGKAFKMLRLLSTDENEGDIHFFERKGDAWIFVPDYSFINLNGNQNLVDLYQVLPRSQNIDFYIFIEFIGQALYN